MDSRQNIIAIPSVKGTTNHTTSDSQAPPSPPSSLSAGTIAGIVIGVVLVILVGLTLGVYVVRKLRHSTTGNITPPEELPASSVDMKEMDGAELPNEEVIEMPADPTSLNELPVGETSPHEMAAVQTSPHEMAADECLPQHELHVRRTKSKTP